MVHLILLCGVVIPLSFVLVNLTVFLALKGFKTPFGRTLSDMTNDWIRFMKQGIPIPTDYERINVRFANTPVLIRPLFHEKEVSHQAK
ncbi:MAG: hypothetical protein ACE5GK_02915 [Nitrospiria bacterium]